MPGLSGQFFKAFGFTVVIAVLMSLLVARMITPLIAAYFLHSKGVQPHASGKAMDKYLGLLKWSLDTRKSHAYSERNPGFWGKVKSFRFDHRLAMVLAGFLALGLTGFALVTLPMSFQPPVNVDYSSVNIDMPPGSTLIQTDSSRPRVCNHPTRPRRRARVRAHLCRIRTPQYRTKHKRTKTSIDFERALAPTLAKIPDARVSFQSQNGGGPGGGRDVMLYLGGEDPVKLNQAAVAIADQMATLPGLRAPRVMGDTPAPEITIKPRFDLAANLGVTTAALSQTIRIATLGDIEQNSAKFSLSDRQVPIQVSLSENERRDLSTLENLPVPTASGGSVPLKAVAEIGFGAGPTTVQRTNQERRTQVGADLAPGMTTGDVWPKINALPAVKNCRRGFIS